MTKEELAEKLDGGEYGNEVSRLLAKDAKESGLLIVYGASDDLIEFDGAWRDEADVIEGGEVAITRTAPLESECSKGHECPYFQEMVACSSKIKAIWCDGELDTGEPAWRYETDIPHAKFIINEDGDPYCEGIVLDIDEIKSSMFVRSSVLE